MFTYNVLGPLSCRAAIIKHTWTS